MRAEELAEDYVQVVPGLATPLSVALNHAGDRGFVTFEPDYGRAESAFAGATEALLEARAVRHVHADVSVSQRVLEAARRSGATLSVDAYDAGEQLASEAVRDVVAAADLLFVNEAEALAMTGAASEEEAGRELAARCPHVVVKRGARGARAYVAADVVEAPTKPVEVVDATGAGDCFAAGYLWGRLAGLPPGACLAVGNLCGGMAVAELGGYRGAPTIAELTAAARAAGVPLA
jgi:sugar/nucleoside kinase (ribokinase family)